MRIDLTPSFTRKHGCHKFIFCHLNVSNQNLDLNILFPFSFSSQVEKSQALEFILHVADISNPAKDWELHRQWTSRIMEEFFCQVSEMLLNSNLL